MSSINIQDLEGMKRADLQKLAKKAGIKANMKTVQLIKALKQHFMQESDVKTSDAEEKPVNIKETGTPEVNKHETTDQAIKNSSGKKTKKIKRSTFEIAPEDSVTNPQTQHPGQKRKRGSSSSKQPSPVQDANKDGPPCKKKRSRGGSFDVCTKRTSPRLSTKEQTMKSPNPDGEKEEATKAQPDPELRATIMAEIDKKIKEKSQISSGGKIPRFAAFAAKNQEKKPITPGNKNWTKLHQKQFQKMEGIDVYLERKRKRMEAMSASAKKAMSITDEAKTAADTLKAMKTPKSAVRHVTIAKPVVRIKTPNVTLKSPKPFVPTITSISKIKTNFRKSALKTPLKPVLPPLLLQNKTETPANTLTRKSFGSTLKKSQSRKSTLADRKSMGESRKSVGSGLAPVTPNPKKVFDLKESLNKPLTYKPHTGKLKPLGDPTYQKAVKPTSLAKAKEDIKKPKIKTRNDRRTAYNQRRQNLKNNSMMARRGIIS